MAAVGEAKALEEAMGMAELEEGAMGMAEGMGMAVVVADVMAAEAAMGEAIAAEATEEKEGSEGPCLFPGAMPQWRIPQARPRRCEPYVRDREWRGRSRACARGIDTQQSGMGAGEGGEEGDRRRGDHLHAREGWEREGREEGAEAAHPR